uniref:Uncharacterized protein n=1 Tax=Lactuca sativa TaxID=4236 RepID=A0A9R1XE40_LACSA|nr:hypothetical protein LSAT_V11C500262860 [Lactuca sativa]
MSASTGVTIGDIKRFIFNRPFLQVGDADAIFGKGSKRSGASRLVYFAEDLDVWNRLAWGIYLWDFTYEDLDDTWNKINNYFSLSEHRQTLKYSASGFKVPIRIWIYKMLPVVRAGGYALRKKIERCLG